ncbi:MAG: two pore domain potassium channel family protein [Lachnospiraceae bacterium]|nr:two pore domain potassium channel family protein [Lachnospiraceae bacterium]
MTQVIYGKRQQLVSSVVLILILMTGASLCMYSLEHEAQPEVFSNAFSGIWWAASTLLTIGYGDIYPVTILGKMLGIIISFLGVGMVANRLLFW